MGLGTPELEGIALANCDTESIHDIDRIQTFGCLLGTTMDLREILYVSDNSTEFFGHGAEAILGMSPSELFSAEMLHDVRNVLGRPTSATQREMAGDVETSMGTFNLGVHRRDDVAILELTPSGESSASVAEAIMRLRWLTSSLDESGDMDVLVESAVKCLRTISGYDRVMACRFGPDGSGEITAEDRAAGVDSFLGFCFPKEDIPQQERQLSIETPIRIIADVRAEPVSLIAKPGREPLDLSLAILRGTMPVHTTYLQNMGVGATLTLPVVFRSELRGLLFFHHYSPRHPGGGMDHVLELAGRYISRLIVSTLERQTTESQQYAFPLANALVTVQHESSVSAASMRPVLAEIRKLIPSAGVAYRSDSMTVLEGQCPDAVVLDEVIDALEPMSDDVLVSESLGSTISPDRLGGIAGAMKISFGVDDGESILFFRQPVSETVTWAGSPEKTLDLSNEQTRLIPRASFAAFEQQMEGRSDPWEVLDFVAASGLQRAISAAIPVFSADRDALVESLELMVQELNHRVRNILALVQSIIYQSRATDVASDSFDALEHRIFALATAHNLLSENSVRSLSLSDAVWREAGPHDPVRIEVDGPPVGILTDAATVFLLVLHELFSNAAKHGALSVPTGRLDISWELGDDGLHLTWTESGGPTVIAPAKIGFGYSLIENALDYEIDGTTEMDFRPEGLVMRIHLPTSALAAVDPMDGSPTPTRAPALKPTTGDVDQVLDGNVLILEDDFVIAMQTNDEAKRLGATKVFPASTVKAAIQFIDDEQIDFAILDINLGTERSTAVAAKLTELGIPFLFVTGYDSGISWLADFGDQIVLRKPATVDSLQHAIIATKARSGGGPARTDEGKH